MPSKAIVIDANILVRAVLGRRVREIIETYSEHASFFAPAVTYAEAEEHLPTLVLKTRQRSGEGARITARPARSGRTDRERGLQSV